MAHNINFNKITKKHSFVSVKQRAWHGLGQIVEELATSKEVIKHSGLDFEVGLTEVFTKFGDIEKAVPKTYATYRTDTNDAFGIVGERYNVVQNREAFLFFDEIVEKGLAKYETAGALGKGETIFISSKLNNTVKVRLKNGVNDEVEMYAFLSSSHDGSKPIICGITPIRIVCNNTLNLAYTKALNSISIKHSKNALNRLEEATRLLSIIEGSSEENNLLLNRFSKTEISDNIYYNMLYDLLLTKEQKEQLLTGELSTRAKNTIKQINKYYFEHPTQKDIVGTFYGAYNSITGYLQNVKNTDNSKKMQDILNGGNKLALESSSYIDKLVELSYNHNYDLIKAIL